MTTEPAMARDSNDSGDTAKSKRKLSGIRQWPKDECPRERLLSRGPHALTDAELLAIRHQCRARKVLFFFKQWSGVRKHLTGRQLYGRTYDEMPSAFFSGSDAQSALAL